MNPTLPHAPLKTPAGPRPWALRVVGLFAFLILILPTPAAPKPGLPDDSWMQEYYQHPHPERFDAEVKKMQAAGVLQNEGAMPPLAAFLSRLFLKGPPAQLTAWLAVIDQLPAPDQQVFLVALRWTDLPAAQDALRRRADGKAQVAKYAQKLLDSKAPVLDQIKNPTPEELDMCWGAFFATGDSVYALTVIRCAAQPTKSGPTDLTQQAARWSLKALCSGHPRLREINDAFYKTATPEERKSLEELFKK